ncbi:MAG: hypothetical protein HQL51_03935 [Magnetococcales bacterium]|nr:hypothetical protein [Magnetococcales bacterium]
MGDYFALQPLIVQRLQGANIPDLGGVLTARDVAALLEGRTDDGGVYVLYDGETVPPGDDYRAGGRQIVLQQWLVILVTKNYAAPAAGDLDRAGPLLWAINEQLQGWTPGPGFDALIKVSSPRTSFSEKNAFYALRYQCAIQTQGSDLL